MQLKLSERPFYVLLIGIAQAIYTYTKFTANTTTKNERKLIKSCTRVVLQISKKLIWENFLTAQGY